jgi:hypothetical protein
MNTQEKRFTVVIPVTEPTVGTVEKLAEVIEHFGNAKGYLARLVIPASFNHSNILLNRIETLRRKLERSFDSVTVLKISGNYSPTSIKARPVYEAEFFARNNFFHDAVEAVKKSFENPEPILWLTSRCCPTNENWLQLLQRDFDIAERMNRPIVGAQSYAASLQLPQNVLVRDHTELGQYVHEYCILPTDFFQKVSCARNIIYSDLWQTIRHSIRHLIFYTKFILPRVNSKNYTLNGRTVSYEFEFPFDADLPTEISVAELQKVAFISGLKDASIHELVLNDFKPKEEVVKPKKEEAVVKTKIVEP